MQVAIPTRAYKLPKVLKNYWESQEMAEKKITEASVLSLVAKHKITASRGAELLDMSEWDFHDLMYENGVTLWDDTPEEITEGVKGLQSLLEKHKRVKK